ncbi:hypothetical protein JCM6882_004649 [Rhodosporidiobolus microsporus]
MSSSARDAQRSMAHFSPRTDPPAKRPAPSSATPAPRGKRIKDLPRGGDEEGEGDREHSPTPRSERSALRWMPEIGEGKTLQHAVYKEPKPSEKVAAFNLDHTIIRPLGDARYSDSADDWRWWSANEPKAAEEEEKEKKVTKRLRKLHADGYAIVFFTAQAHDSQDLWSEYRKRLRNVAEELDIPLRIFVAMTFDIYRKPAHGAWLEFVKRWNGGKEVDLSKSFYVGDAAGKGGSKQDYDRKFAHNVGVEFFTPEEFFLGKEKSKNWAFKGWISREYDQEVPLYSPTNTPLVPRPISEFEPAAPDIVVLVGPPGCGKTSFALKYLTPRGYKRIVSTPSRAPQRANAYIPYSRAQSSDPSAAVKKASPSANLVLDVPLPSPSSRKFLLQPLRTLPSSKPRTLRCFHFLASEKLAKHNNVFSVLFEEERERGKREQGMARAFTGEKEYREWYAEWGEPTKEEGWDEIKRINFKFDLDGADGEARLKRWHKFLDCYPAGVGHK